MSSIITTEEADARVKELMKRSDGLMPVITGDALTIEGTNIRYWQILYANPDRPDSEPDVLIGSSEFFADNDQILSFGSGNALGPQPFSFKDEFLRRYHRA